MHFVVKNNSGENIENLMRSLRYRYWGASQKDGKMQFVRTLETGGAYPRFHIYLQYNKQTKKIAIDLHFDQRKPVYQGTTAHRGEYEGEILKKEDERIKAFMQKF